ncbi:hypothetical protein [Virgisporangium aurantiacum]|uniref:hypothetical protein n=1 Tax=Virgisporangium aurantiacum TaxID=175570 RepID=UPI0019524CC2|nr:hypothetical protein [Virgisporangium aurantiacum]
MRNYYRTAAVLALLVAGLAVPVTPAVAATALSGVHEEIAESLKNSDPSKTKVATCTTGTVIGGNATIVDGDGSVAISQIEPDISTNTVTVTAKETDKTDADWKVTARALCADKPAGLDRVHRISQTNSDPKTLFPHCSGDQTLLSVGWKVEDGNGEILVNQVGVGTDGDAATSASVSAREDGDYDGDWTLHAFLLCADPIAGQNVTYASTESNSIDEPKAFDATCSNGQTATGGAAMAVSLDAATQTELLLDSVYTHSLGGTFNSFQATAYEEDTISDDWYLFVVAVCT